MEKGNKLTLFKYFENTIFIYLINAFIFSMPDNWQ